MKINNVNNIRSDDFPQEYQQLVDQLSNILSPFMQQVVELSDGRIDFENRVENIIQVEFSVDSNGTPILNNKIQTNKSNIRGFQVISVFHTTDVNILPDSQPFIAYTPLGNGLVQVNKITGLPSNQKFRLTVIVY